MQWGRILPATLILLGLGSVARAQTAPTAPRLRPPARLETIPPSPGPSYVWASGKWLWNGTRFIWVRGRYRAARPGPDRFVHGYMEGDGALQTYVPGHYAGPPSAWARASRPETAPAAARPGS